MLELRILVGVKIHDKDISPRAPAVDAYHTVNNTPPPFCDAPITIGSWEALLPDHRHRGHGNHEDFLFQDSTGHDDPAPNGLEGIRGGKRVAC